MRKITLNVSLTEYDSRAELNAADQELLQRADEAGKSAYAPYSAFHVGAAVLLSDGVIVTGNNQENVAYPSGLCAERVALFAANATHPAQPVTAIAITCYSDKFTVNQPLTPCGACRQVIAETERRYGKPIRIVLAARSGKILVADSIKELLPLSFEADGLKS